MTRKFFFVLLLTLLIAGRAGADIIIRDTNLYTDSLLKIKRNSESFIPYIKIIGHSWAVGAFEGYEEFFWQYGIIIDQESNLGTSLQWATNKAKEISDTNEYDAIFLLSGINDYRNSPQVIANDFAEFFNVSLSKVPVIFICNIANYKPAEEVIAIMNEWLLDIGKKYPEIQIIDLYSEIEIQKENGLEMSTDGLHPQNYDSIQDLFIYYILKYYNLLDQKIILQ
ncbi:MAG: SGNH/GDSL hydrolase family protein [Ignavibacteria bacterium]|nr:SGNH/GDSL hydrolase family protein [Ignavibacteria bacterium]